MCEVLSLPTKNGVYDIITQSDNQKLEKIRHLLRYTHYIDMNKIKEIRQC